MRDAAVSPSPRPSSAALWDRIFRTEGETYPPEVARYLLRLDFPPEDHRRVEVLSYKAQDGSLAPEERAELEDYIAAAAALGVLQSRARVSLKKAGVKP